jgi:hypothetical protein
VSRNEGRQKEEANVEQRMTSPWKKDTGIRHINSVIKITMKQSASNKKIVPENGVLQFLCHCEPNSRSCMGVQQAIKFCKFNNPGSSSWWKIRPLFSCKSSWHTFPDSPSTLNFFYQHKRYRPTESSRSTCHATFLNIKCFDASASESLTTDCCTSREREMFVRYHERRQDNIQLGCYPLQTKNKWLLKKETASNWKEKINVIFVPS